MCQFTSYILLLVSLTFPMQTAPRDQGRKAVVRRGKRSKAGGRKRRRGQLETVKMREERGKRMEGRERGIKQFHVNFWFDVAKR